jgi:hypothetical protein
VHSLCTLSWWRMISTMNMCWQINPCSLDKTVPNYLRHGEMESEDK